MLNIDQIKGMIEHVGEAVSPDGDWMPTLLVFHKSKFSVFGMPIPMNDDLDREIVATLIKRTLIKEKADMGIWIITAWGLRLDNVSDEVRREAMEAARAHRVHLRPDKVELVVALIARRGEPMTQLSGRVIRHPDTHPTLEWDELPTGDANFGGRFPEAVREGVEGWHEGTDGTN
jgi:hypothetical protein